VRTRLDDNRRRLLPGEAVDALRAAGVDIIKERSGDGAEIRCRCRDHPDRDGHLYVNALTGAAFCHKCGLSTNLAALCGDSLKAPTPAAALRQDILEATAGHYQRSLSEEARQYLTEERAIPPEIIERFRIGWAEGGLVRHLLEEKGFALEACLDAGVLKRHEDGRVRDFFYHRIVFPNIVGGRVVHLSGRLIRDGKPKWLHLPGEITHPYNADALRHPKAVWTEGIFDVLSAEAWGYPAAAGLGTTVKETWRADVPDGHSVRVCLDGDEAGKAGAPKAARFFGPRARIAALPAGKDINDLLREGRRDQFETCLATAQDLLTFQINQIPVGISRPELFDRLDGLLNELAGVDPALSEAYLAVIKKRFRLNREETSGYRQVIATRWKDLHRQTTLDETAPGEVTYTALFEGLVDLVEHEGRPAFLVVEGSDLRVVDRVERDGKLLVPPPQDQIPWLLPRGHDVLRWHREDSDSRLYDDLVAYHQSASELPSEAHYHLIAAWDLHTYLLEQAEFSPVICLYAVPERGKTRTGKAMTYVAYRAIHVESLRDPYIVRFAANFRGTIFFDVMNLWKKAEKSGSEDILLGRFERGITVPRVNWPERGPHRDTAYYPIFGPTVLGTNDPIHHILDTRAITITMPQTRRRFELDVTPEAARPYKERLLAFRARHLGEALPEVEKPAPGRLGDILKVLLQVIRLVRPETEGILRGLIIELQGDRLADKADTLEAEILRIMDGLRQEVVGGVLPVQPITDALNADRPAEKRISPQRVGKRLKSLGFQSGRRTAAGATIKWDEDKLVRAVEAYGLRETTHSAQTTRDALTWPPRAPGDAESVLSDSPESVLAGTLQKPCAPANVESVECAESWQGVEASRAHTLPQPDEVAGLPPEWRDAYDERFAIMTIDGGLPLSEAMKKAVECVRREFGI